MFEVLILCRKASENEMAYRFLEIAKILLIPAILVAGDRSPAIFALFLTQIVTFKSLLKHDLNRKVSLIVASLLMYFTMQ